MCPRKASAPLENLPTPVSPFIGRKRELAEVNRLLSESRLLTLTGAGGCGKTRLAIQAAKGLVAEYEDGVWLTELAPLSDPGLLSQAVASSLGVREQSGRSINETLYTYLQTRTALLLLDNCEHLVESCAQFSAALLEACPNMHLLATSREPLGVPGEITWVVPPLSLPDPQPWRKPTSEQEDLSAYERSEAIQMFVSCAAAAYPGFSLSAENAPWAANICRRLDGIPLAIELAAAQVRTYSVRQIAEHLDDRFQPFTSHRRGVPDRHKTLEAALDWSYALLSEAEQQLFQRLSVFAGGWTLEAAEAVCGGDRGLGELMDGLSSLVDKSLVAVDRFQERRRYRFLEPIRMYARQKLDESGAIEQIRNQHLDYYTRWAEASEKHLFGQEQGKWIALFVGEHDNLRAALEWSQTCDGKTGLRLAGACGHFWRLNGYFSEGRRRLSTALAHPDAQERTIARTRALHWAANLAYMQSDYPETKKLAEEELQISRELGGAGREGVARALDMLGEMATEIGDYEIAPKLFEEALQIYREIHNKGGTADMLMQLGWAAMRAGDYERAGSWLHESLILFRELGISTLLGLVLAGLGELAVRQGQYDRAVELLEESLALRRELGERWGIAGSLGSLGWVALLQRDFSRMRELLGESLAIRMEIGDQGGIAWCLEKLAEAARLEAQKLPSAHRRQGYRRAARLFGAAQALRLPLNSVIDPADQPEYEDTLAFLRSALGADSFDAAWAEGSGMPLQEIVDQALTHLVTAEDIAALSDSQAAKAKFGGLSPREREAAALIAQGKTNREIAEIMVVRAKTVETYVTRMLNKLGFQSRVQIATWALEAGLARTESED